MTIALDSPANAYLEKLKKQSGLYSNSSYNPNQGNTNLGIKDNQNAMPDFAKFQNPNENFTAQRALLEGSTPQSGTSRTNLQGIQERDQLTAQMGDIATDTEQNKLNQRRSQQDSMLNSFSGDLGGDFSGTGAGSGLDSDQLNNAKTIASVGKQRGLGQNEITIALMTALAESGLHNVAHGDRDSVGLFQQRTSQGWGSVNQIMNPTYSAGKFYDSLVKTGGDTPWQRAQNVQRSAFSDGSNYKAQYGLAQSAYNAIFNPTSKSFSAGMPNGALGTWLQQNNNAYIDWDGYYGAQCVDLYNKYTATFVGGKNIMVGYAPEIYDHYDSSVYTRFGNYVTGAAGDVAVFKAGGYTPYGHVAIVVGDNGNGTLRVLQSNATSAGSAGPSIISNISKATLMGYLRPKKFG